MALGFLFAGHILSLEATRVFCLLVCLFISVSFRSDDDIDRGGFSFCFGFPLSPERGRLFEQRLKRVESEL